MPKRGAKLFYKAIKSAITNARLKLKTSDETLRFKLLTVEQGPKFKRFRAGGRGGAKPYEHKTAHIKIILVAEKGAEKPAEKVAIKKVETKTAKKVTKVKKVSAKK